MSIIGQSKAGIRASDRIYGGKRFYLDLVYTDKAGAQGHAKRMRTDRPNRKGRPSRVVRLKGKYWGIYVLSLGR